MYLSNDEKMMVARDRTLTLLHEIKRARGGTVEGPGGKHQGGSGKHLWQFLAKVEEALIEAVGERPVERAD